MAKTTLGKNCMRLFIILVSLLMSVSLTVNPAYAVNGYSDRDETDPKARVTSHMEKMREKFPGIGEKARQTEEKLRGGIMSPKESCSNCHIKGQGSRP